MDYYEEKFRRSGDGVKTCCFCLIGIAVLAVILFFSSCKAVKNSVSESTEKSDSVRIEYIEKVVEKPVKVIVEVPAEKKERETPDTTSFLETQFAKSTASLRWQAGIPFLFHSLENIPQKIEKTDTVPVVEKEKTLWKTRRVTYTKTEIREKQIPWWKTFLMWSGSIAYLIFGLIFFIKAVRYRLF